MLHVKHKDVIVGIKHTSDEDVLGVIEANVAKLPAVTSRDRQLVKHVTENDFSNEGVAYSSDEDLYGVTDPCAVDF